MTEPVSPPVAVPRPRLAEIDGLRAVAFFSIVVGHAIALLVNLEHSPVDMAVAGTVLALTRFALPAFMTISAVLIGRAIAEDRHAMRFGRLAVPYAVWTLVYIVLGHLVAGGQAVSLVDLVREYVVALVTGTGFYHLWYVLIALQIVIVVPFIARGLNRLSIRDRWLAVACATLFNMVLLGQVWGPVTRWLPSSGSVFGAGADRNLLFWLGYVVLGAAIGLDYGGFVDRLRRARLILGPLYVVTSTAIGVLVVHQAIVTGGDYAATSDISRVMQPWILPFEMLSTLAWLDLGGVLARGRLSTVLRTVSDLSFGGYLIHPLVILFATQLILQYVTQPDPLLTVAAVAVVGILGSLWLTRAFSTTSARVAEVVVGVRRAEG